MGFARTSESFNLLKALGLTCLLWPGLAGGQFILKDRYIGQDFFHGWMWETFDDPTHGRVNYVSKDAAIASNLSHASDSVFTMRASTARSLTSWDRGRDSVRISSHASYGDSIVVLDVIHMPTGCATWPAFWSVSAHGPWPKGGEIDILEGVHRETRNLVSLHTLPDCVMPAQRFHSGAPTATVCDASLNSNQGCGVQSHDSASFGQALNDRGGGWFVMRRTKQDGIAVWFWGRDDPSVPPEISDRASNMSVSSIGSNIDLILGAMHGYREVIEPNEHWGIPDASFPPQRCDMDKYFDEHVLVFDLTFCGDWAGASPVWAGSGCGSWASGACNTFVDSHPEGFEKAYWEIGSVRVYVPVA